MGMSRVTSIAGDSDREIDAAHRAYLTEFLRGEGVTPADLAAAIEDEFMPVAMVRKRLTRFVGDVTRLVRAIEAPLDQGAAEVLAAGDSPWNALYYARREGTDHLFLAIANIGKAIQRSRETADERAERKRASKSDRNVGEAG